MTKLMDHAVAAITRLLPERQDEIARLLLTMTADPEPLNEDELLAIAEAEADLAWGEAVPLTVTDEFWRTYGASSNILPRSTQRIDPLANSDGGAIVATGGWYGEVARRKLR